MLRRRKKNSADEFGFSGICIELSAFCADEKKESIRFAKQILTRCGMSSIFPFQSCYSCRQRHLGGDFSKGWMNLNFCWQKINFQFFKNTFLYHRFWANTKCNHILTIAIADEAKKRFQSILNFKIGRDDSKCPVISIIC